MIGVGFISLVDRGHAFAGLIFVLFLFFSKPWICWVTGIWGNMLIGLVL
jgi:hypothetical protein